MVFNGTKSFVFLQSVKKTMVLLQKSIRNSENRLVYLCINGFKTTEWLKRGEQV